MIYRGKVSKVVGYIYALLDWVTSAIIEAMNKRDYYTRVKYHENKNIWRNEVVKMIRNAKRDYYIGIIEKNKSDSKAFWKIMRELSPKSKALDPTMIIDGDNEITEPKDIANRFNDVFSNITEQYLSDQHNSEPDYETLKHYVNDKVPKDIFFKIRPMDSSFVERELKNLD